VSNPSSNSFNAREEGAVLLEQTGTIAQLLLSRPSSLNALTWTMYEQLEAHLNKLAEDPSIRVIVIRGDGDAFAAGTDISQFKGFTGEDGIQYERRIDRIIHRLENMPIPVIAAVHGSAVGGGLLIAAASDLRYATPAAKFGAPMARTLGNCLSLDNYRRLVREFGPMRTKELLFTSRLFSAEEALQAGFVTSLFDQAEFLPKVMEVAQRISQNAPLTIKASKEALRRLNQANQNHLSAEQFDDVIALVYGSEDFAEGVSAYIEKRKPNWHL
jgi:enoyl-CoA hydratase/carnithine racemase